MTKEKSFEELCKNVESECGVPIELALIIQNKKKIAYQKGKEDCEKRVKKVIEELSWSGVSQSYNEINPHELLKKLGLKV